VKSKDLLSSRATNHASGNHQISSHQAPKAAPSSSSKSPLKPHQHLFQALRGSLPITGFIPQKPLLKTVTRCATTFHTPLLFHARLRSSTFHTCSIRSKYKLVHLALQGKEVKEELRFIFLSSKSTIGN
jgi:hypothetical protein